MNRDENNLELIRRKLVQYPFTARTGTGSLKPHVEAATQQYGMFIAVPIRGVQQVWWGFATEAARDLFTKNHATRIQQDNRIEALL